MAHEYVYPKWIEKAWTDGLFQFNNESNSFKYNNPKYKKNYKFEFNPIKDHNIRKGDTICFGGRVYRNDGVWIWDGNKIIELDNSIDDYGGVPRLFKVGKDYKPNHWINIIEHNTIIWLEDELLEKIEIENDFIIEDDMKIMKGSVIMFDKKYTIRIAMDKNYDKNIKEEIMLKNPPFYYEGEHNLSLYLQFSYMK